MGRIAKMMGRNSDIPWESLDRIALSAAGTATDYEVGVFYNPDLTKIMTAGSPTGAAGDIPNSILYLDSFMLSVEAALTGAATNNFLWQVRQWRAGAAINQYALSSVTAIAVGANTIAVTQAAPAQQPLQNVRVNDPVFISGGVGTAEWVQITAVSIANGTVTFTAVNTHSGAYTIACSALASVWYNAGGVTEAVNTPHQIATIPNLIKGGDLLTFQRLSFGTGLASPNVTVALTYVMGENSPNNPMRRG